LVPAFAAAAAAAVSKYPPAAASRGFSGGAAGWTSSSGTDGLCQPPLLCATVANSYQDTGGADSGGFIRSAYTGVAGATAVGGTTRGVVRQKVRAGKATVTILKSRKLIRR
jgi:hypothetical protein